MENLSALIEINPPKIHLGGNLINCDFMNRYLLSLSQGWESKGVPFSYIHFEYGIASLATESVNEGFNSYNIGVIEMPNIV